MDVQYSTHLPPPGLKILEERRPSAEAVDVHLKNLESMATTKEREIIERARAVNRGSGRSVERAAPSI